MVAASGSTGGSRSSTDPALDHAPHAPIHKPAVDIMEMTAQSRNRLLIVQNDQAVSVDLLEYFRNEGYAATTASDANTALNLLCGSSGYDVTLLDTMLPGKDGYALLEEAGELPIDTSFFVLSSQTALEDRLRAFALGVDDYVTKPFSIEELHARVKVILSNRRGAQPPSTGSYSADGLTIDFESNTCFRDGTRIPFTSHEFDILRYLVQNRGRVVSREELRQGVWAPDDSVCLRTIDRHLANIRSKLQSDPEAPAYLQTVYGKGYRFAADEDEN